MVGYDGCLCFFVMVVYGSGEFYAFCSVAGIEPSS